MNFVRPAHGLVALHGDDGRAGARARPRRRPDDARPSLRRQPRADRAARRRRATRRSCATKARCIAELRRAARRDHAPARMRPPPRHGSRRSTTTRCSTRSRRWSSCPNVLACRFDAEFLAVPPECLILTMKANQKYFPLLDADGRLTNRFLVVSNIAPADPARIVEGNERVVRPRLADAKFFFDQDRKRTLESRVSGARQGRLPRQARQPGRSRPARARASPRGSPTRIGADVGAGRSRRAARQGRPADRHGRRVSRAARDHGRLLRGARRRAGRRRRRDRGPVRNRRGDGRCRAAQPVGEALVDRRPRRDRWSASGASA